MQLEALKAAGCEKIFSEKMTGRQQIRPELDACLSFLREGDTLVVYKLDRLGRSLKNILTLLEDFKNRGIQFLSLIHICLRWKVYSLTVRYSMRISLLQI